MRPRPEPLQLEFEELFELQFDELLLELFEEELDELLLELLDEEFEEEFDELLEDEFELEFDELFELEFEELLLELFEEELLELLEARITRCARSFSTTASRAWKLQPPRARASSRSAGCGAAIALPPVRRAARAASGPHAPRRVNRLSVIHDSPVASFSRPVRPDARTTGAGRCYSVFRTRRADPRSPAMPAARIAGISVCGA